MVPETSHMKIIAINIKIEPSNVYKKNLNDAKTRSLPPQIPIIKNIGIIQPQKIHRKEKDLEKQKRLSLKFQVLEKLSKTPLLFYLLPKMIKIRSA